MGDVPERIEIRFTDPAAYMRVVSAGGELVYIGGELALVDARAWPPTVTHRRGDRVHDAARSASGRWLVYVAGDDRKYRLRWFDSIASTLPASEHADPVPERDFSAFYNALPADSRAHLAPRPERVETIHVLGELPVVVPLHVGIDDHKLPIIQRDGKWTPLEVPPFERPAGSPVDCRVVCTRLSDGTDVLGWDGRVYACRDSRFEPLDDQRLVIVAMPWQIVPSAERSLFMVDSAQLVELGPRGRVDHLPGRSARLLHALPTGRLLVNSNNRWLLYDPARDTVVSLQHWFGPRDVVIGATADYLLVHDQDDSTLRRLPLDELATLPTEQASMSPVVPPLATVDERGAISRAQVAASGTQIVMAFRNQVRHHAHDNPDGFVELETPVIAVARQPARTAALDATGMLHVFAARETIAATQVTRQPRTVLSIADGRWLVVGRDASAIVEPDCNGARVIGFAGGIAAAIDPDGTIVFVGDDRRLALDDAGVLVDLPGTVEQLIAIVPLGRRRFACAGQSHLFVLDLANPELEIWIAHKTSPLLATDLIHDQLAFAIGDEVFVTAIDLVAQPRVRARFDSYDLDEEAERRIQGLHYLADGRLVVALPLGAGVILDFSGRVTRRMDPHPGDAGSRFTFAIDERRLRG